MKLRVKSYKKALRFLFNKNYNIEYNIFISYLSYLFLKILTLDTASMYIKIKA